MLTGKSEMMLRHNTSVRVIWFLCLAAVAVQAAPSAEQVRSASLEYVLESRQAEGIEKMAAYLSQQLGKTSRMGSRDLAQLAATAECIRFLQLSQKAAVPPETATWILGSGSRLHSVVDAFAPQDKAEACMKLLTQLRKHDPAGCDEYFELMLAISLVLDHPGKTRMHGQQGKNLLPYKPDPVALYDYFKALYSSGQAKIDYENLGVSELVFVVHVPAPVSELEWARANADGSLSRWGEKYSEIAYDHARLQGSRFSWDKGVYTLQNIQRQGGICVDQAYYAVLTARAHGIPAIYFRGSGTSANHAWFSFMKAPGDWVLDVGRYQGQQYTTGYAVNPQTRRQMTDHDVEYTCEHSLHSSDAAQASAYISVAEVLLTRDPANALRCARRARALTKRAMRPWEIERQLLMAQGDYAGLAGLFYEMKDAFRKYPDILVASGKQIEKSLRKAGRNEEADQLVRSLAGAVDDDRDDLSRSFENQRIKQIVAAGDFKKARKELEQLLDDQQDQGSKVFGMIRDYIKLTKQSGQTKEAVRFLEGYVDDLIKGYNFPPAYEQGLLKLLSTAYENNGDTKDAEKLKTRIERLNY